MRYRVSHVTSYEYATAVAQSYNVAHLLPRDTANQQCVSTRLDVEPRPSSTSARLDYFGNHTRQFSIHVPHRKLRVTAESIVVVAPAQSTLSLDLGPTCAEVTATLRADSSVASLLAREFTVNSPLVARSDSLREYAQGCFADDRPFLHAVRDLVRKIFTEFTYDPAFTTISTPLEHVLAHFRGVCQDFAHLAIGCLRSLGYAARYVSGYIETLPPEGKPRIIGADASHAWFAVYSPGEGWFEFDPTNDLLVGEQHIAVAWGRDFSDVTPLRGVIFGDAADQQLDVAVDVRRLE